MAAPVIRPLRAADFEAWDDMWQAYLAFYQTELAGSDRKAAFARLIDPETQVNGLIAELDGKPVGLVHYLFHDHVWRPDGVIYLQDLFTRVQARGQGVGAALIEAVYEAADRAGVPRVYWLTQEFNEPARRLYDRVGQLTPFIRYDRP